MSGRHAKFKLHPPRPTDQPSPVSQSPGEVEATGGAGGVVVLTAQLETRADRYTVPQARLDRAPGGGGTSVEEEVF